MKKGFAPILIIIVALIILIPFVYFAFMHAIPFALLNYKDWDSVPSSQTEQQSTPSSANKDNETSVLTISGKVIGNDIKTGFDFAAFKVQSENTVYTVNVPQRELAGVFCDQDSPWPKEGEFVKASGQLIGQNVITCKSKGDYFKRDKTANWKTYTNSKYKYSFKYPIDTEVVSGVEGDKDIGNTASVGVQGSTSDLGNTFFINTYEASTTTLAIIEKDYRKDVKNTNFTYITIDGVKGIVFLTSGYVKRLEFVNNGILYDFTLDLPVKNNFDQILSTFKFLN